MKKRTLKKYINLVRNNKKMTAKHARKVYVFLANQGFTWFATPNVNLKRKYSLHFMIGCGDDYAERGYNCEETIRYGCLIQIFRD